MVPIPHTTEALFKVLKSNNLLQVISDSDSLQCARLLSVHICAHSGVHANLNIPSLTSKSLPE